MYAQSKIEDTVLEEVENYLSYLRKLNYREYAKDYNQEEFDYIKQAVSMKNKELESCYEEINALKSEISKAY